MATHLRLIRSTGSLARIQSHLPNTSLYTLRSHISYGRLVSYGPIGSTLINRGFSGTFAKRSNHPTDDSKGLKDTPGKNDAAQKTTEEEALNKASEEAERKRIEAQDAALKEILDSAAAEKRQIEQEMARVAEEKARQAAKRAAEEEARQAAKKAAEEEARRAAKESAEKQAKLQRSKSTNISNAESEATSASNSPGKVTKASNLKTGTTTASDVSKNNSQLLGSEASSTLNASQSSAAGATQSKNDSKEKASQAAPDESSAEPFTSKLLPYKRSIGASTEYIRSAIPDSIRQLTESVKRKDYRETISQLAEHLNSITGYNAINELKHKVIAHGDCLDEARIKLVQAKQAYEDAISTRSDTQKAINDLLQRKHLWSPNDVIRFTDLYRSEHANEQSEQKTKAAYKLAESDVESKSRMLTRVIMERYHEEQVWSDKIRAASTYGTWGLVGVNVMAFLIVQAFVEPRRRRKQVERYEELVQDLTERGILPERTSDLAVSGANATTPGTANGSVSTSSDAPIAVGGELLGGEDVLLKLMMSTEERLDRMETLLLQQSSGGTGKNFSKEVSIDVYGSPDGEYVLTEDGSIAFLQNDIVETTDMGESWGEGLSQGIRFEIRSDLTSNTTKDRLSLILRDGDAEVPATRRDFLVSSLGGALIGGLIAVAVMMNR
ncbi:sensitivity to high expression protein she9 [Entomortierella chlamydospora]|uniref:Sensitive to high expression protein 9, mitochondrial n=1 Tax=Entomortierella chlamydospora TaxID=101097 RepID=A0A9P6MLR3_9FUNG|nr:sensitivity to high expression protein she9 [Entomortierella chlamydospora]KAG0007096.1 sensitivity to high expression protein she9 [Entomortierella chlamydospora]